MYTFRLDKYKVNNAICILAYFNDEFIGKLSSYLPTRLESSEFCAKTYSENASWAPEALALPYFQDTGEVVIADNVTWPIYRITPLFIKEQFESYYNSRSDIYEAPPFLWNLYEKYVGKL